MEKNKKWGSKRDFFLIFKVNINPNLLFIERFIKVYTKNDFWHSKVRRKAEKPKKMTKTLLQTKDKKANIFKTRLVTSMIFCVLVHNAGGVRFAIAPAILKILRSMCKTMVLSKSYEQWWWPNPDTYRILPGLFPCLRHFGSWVNKC